MGDGAMPRLLTFSLGGNKRASDTCFTDDAVVQQALAHPSSARVAAAKELGASAWNYLGGNSCNTLAGAPRRLRRACRLQVRAALFSPVEACPARRCAGNKGGWRGRGGGGGHRLVLIF